MQLDRCIPRHLILQSVFVQASAMLQCIVTNRYGTFVPKNCWCNHKDFLLLIQGLIRNILVLNTHSTVWLYDSKSCRSYWFIVQLSGVTQKQNGFLHLEVSSSRLQVIPCHCLLRIAYKGARSTFHIKPFQLSYPEKNPHPLSLLPPSSGINHQPQPPITARLLKKHLAAAVAIETLTRIESG